MDPIYDATGKDLFEIEPAGFVSVLGQDRPQDRVQIIDADLSSTVTTATDKLIRIDDEKPWLVMAELHSYWSGNLPYDLVKRWGLVVHRHRLPTSVAVMLLRPSADAPAMTGLFPQANPLGAPWDFPFHVVRLWEVPVDRFLNGPLGLLPLAPLSKFDPADAARVKKVIEQRIKAEASDSLGLTLRTALVNLLALRYDECEIAFWSDLMATLDISHTPLANMFRKEGRVEGRIEGQIVMFLEMGEDKLGEPADAVRATIQAITDEARIRQLRRRLPVVNSWDELLAE